MKQRVKVEVWLLTCERCGWRWHTLATRLPVGCARCKDRNWNQPRIRKHQGSKFAPLGQKRKIEISKR